MAVANNRSQSDWSIDKPDTNFATFIGLNEVKEQDRWAADFLYLKKQKHYKHLTDINAGRKNGPRWYNDSLLTYEAARDLIDIVSGALDLTPVQRYRARRYFVNLDREGLGLKSELVAYCLCAYIVEQDERNQYRRCHPNVPDEKQDDLFQHIAESIGLSSREVCKTYGKIQHLLNGTSVPPVRDDQRDPNHHPGGGI